MNLMILTTLMNLNPSGPNEHNDPDSHPHDPNYTLMTLNTQKSGCSAKFFPARYFLVYAK
jgi:hypothetical protein